MTEAEFLTELAKLLRVDAHALDHGASLSAFPTWDSLSMLSVMTMVHRRSGRVIEGAAMARCRTVGDLIRASCSP